VRITQDIAVDFGCIRGPGVLRRAIVLACVLGLGGCAVSPNFIRPTAPPAAGYTADILRGEDVASDTVQHIDHLVTQVDQTYHYILTE
jgi:hypothetical protein